jgi:glycosyltransferase involved in cell wall biosynthesis
VLHAVSATTFSGIERHVLNLAGELLALGCAVELACPPRASALRAEAAGLGIRLIPGVPPARGARFGSWPAAVARDALRDPPDVLHVHDGRAALGAALLSIGLPTSLVRTQHFARPASVERDGLTGRASLALHRCANTRLDGYLAVSECVAEAARRRRETGRAEVVVIPPAVILASDVAAAASAAARAGLDRPTVVFAGRLEAERRLDVLLRAIPMLRAAVPGCHFVLLGVGDGEPDLRALARELGVLDAITWAGWVAEPQLLLGRAHVYVNTWPWEGFGMAMAEAMGLALPVVAVDSGASSEMVDPGVTGLLVAPADPAALAEALAQILLDPIRAARMGEAGRRLALSRYGAARTASDTLALYRRLRSKAAA